MQLYNDDCFNILPKIADDSVDLVLVDLPYGQTHCEWDICIDLDKMWEQLKRVAKDNTAFVFFTTTRYGYKLIQSNEKWFRYDIVWEKSISCGFLNCKKMPLRNHEMIYVFYKKLPTYNPQMMDTHLHTTKTHKAKNNMVYGKQILDYSVDYYGRYPLSVQKFNSVKSRNHSTEKPTELCEWLIKTYSNEGDKVLDFTMGSGTTGVACKNTNRKFIGIEMNEEIFKVAKKRLQPAENIQIKK